MRGVIMGPGAAAGHVLANPMPPLVEAGIAAGLAATLTLGLSLAVARFCVWRGWLDQPEPRRVHTRPVPRLGGIAIFVAFLTVALIFFRPNGAADARVFAGLIAAGVLVVAAMAYDDVRGMPPWAKLGTQTLAALVVMFPGAEGTLIAVIHNPLVAADQGRAFLPLWVAVPFTWFWVVGMMNTVNWLDGSDGLAGGVVAIAATVMAVISAVLGQPGPALLCAILAGAVIGFLPLNWHPARIFMGDSGAMFLGLALAVLANFGGAKLATMLLLMALPILDTARVIARRARHGHSPLRFDRSHLHHRLLAGGFTQRQIALLFYGITAAFGGLTILGAYLQVHLAGWSPLAWVLPPLGLALASAALAVVLLVAPRYRAWLAARGRATSASALETPEDATPLSTSHTHDHAVPVGTAAIARHQVPLPTG
ncbi:MAG TPA: MraY family glycosyltransferase [Ktedonobacterales bacterium]|jgi:UDP-GlcNAc:undecaprenyl-phosphate GlcNAc-1-phosphate transferase